MPSEIDSKQCFPGFLYSFIIAMATQAKTQLSRFISDPTPSIIKCHVTTDALLFIESVVEAEFYLAVEKVERYP